MIGKGRAVNLQCLQIKASKVLGSQPFLPKLNTSNIPLERQYSSSSLNFPTFANSMKFARFPILYHDSPAYDESESALLSK